MSNPLVYDPNTPKAPSESLADSQEQFLVNFSQLYNIFEVNHIPLDAASNAGNHTIVQMLEQTNSPQTDTGEISVYVKNDVTSPNNLGTTDQIFIRPQGNATEYQLTCYQIYGLTPLATHVPYFTFLPGRILVYFGQIIQLPQNNILSLYPPIAKKIITVSGCALGATPLPKQSADPIEVNGFYTGIKFSQQTLIPVTNYYYLVMANI